MFNCLRYWPTRRIHFSAIHLRVERPTHTGTGQPQLNVIKPVDYRVLCTSAGSWLVYAGGTLTLIVVRRALTEPHTALAGVGLVAFLARFKSWMASFNVERVPFCP